jgi:hypothetical protein
MASLKSPGICVKISEEVLNIRNEQGTKILINGFTPKGDAYSPKYINSLNEFELEFGLPSEPVERYSYLAVRESLEAGADVLFTRLPYGSGAGVLNQEEYTALVFPVIGLSAGEIDVCNWFSNLTQEEYLEKFPWIYDANEFLLKDYKLGSSNLLCDLNATSEPSGVLVMHNYPVPSTGALKQIKFRGEPISGSGDDSVAEPLKFFTMRQVSANSWKVISVIDQTLIPSLSSDETLNRDVDGNYVFNIPGSGLQMEKGDIVAHYAQYSVLKYYPSTQSIKGKSTIVPGSGLSATLAENFVLTSQELQTVGEEYLLNFTFVPEVSGLDCFTLVNSGLKIPEQFRYQTSVLPGDARLEDADYYLLGQPKQITLNEEQYKNLNEGKFSWECGALANSIPDLDLDNGSVRGGIIVVDELREKVCDDHTGWYIGVTDNTNFNPTTDFKSFTGIYGRFQTTCNGVSGSWTEVPEERWNFKTWNLYGELASLSEAVERYAPSQFGTEVYNDHLNVTLWKLTPDSSGNMIKLNAELWETHSGSLNSNRKETNTSGESFVNLFLPEVVRRNNSRLKIFVNKFLSERNCWNNDQTGLPKKRVRMVNGSTFVSQEGLDPQEQMQGYADNLFGLASCGITCEQRFLNECHTKDIGNLPIKLQIALRGVENPEIYDIDLSVDAGLSTVWATRNSVEASNCDVCRDDSYIFDDNVYVNLGFLNDYEGLNVLTPAKAGWDTIYRIFRTFAEDQRVINCGVPIFHIQDPLRQIFVNGKFRTFDNKKVIVSTSETMGKTFARTIWAPLKNLLEGVSSPYVGVWANWLQAYNAFDDTVFWAPSSPFVAAMLARNDENGPQRVGTAPFGLSNGEIRNVIGGQAGLAINPYQKERDKLAEISANPIIYIRNEGAIYSFNHKTTLRSEYALRSRVPVSRVFIELAKQGQEIAYGFLNQPNTIITRTNLRSAIETRLKIYKDNGVLEKYRIVMTSGDDGQVGGLKKRLNVFIYLTFSGWVEEIVLNFIGTDEGVTVETLE